MSPLWKVPPQRLADVVFSEAVLKVFHRHRQRHPCRLEAGGQLFGHFDGSAWYASEASGLRPGDLRTLFTFVPDRVAERREIDERYARGLHYIGDWHTHREESPKPSSTDLNSMLEMVRESKTDLPGFLMVIVGTSGDLHVSFHRRSGWVKLE